MKIVMIVTHYYGNINQFKKYIKNTPVELVIYNKRNNLYGINVPNKGLDIYDKLHYIINNYEKLPDIMIFTTDTTLDRGKKQRTLDYIMKNIKTNNHKILPDKFFLTNHIVKNVEENDFQISEYKNKPLVLSKTSPFRNWLEKNVNEIEGENIYTSKKGTFMVSRNLILNNDLKYYKSLFNIIDNESKKGHDTEVAHYFERAWVEIFCKHNTNFMFHNQEKYGELN